MRGEIEQIFQACLVMACLVISLPIEGSESAGEAKL